MNLRIGVVLNPRAGPSHIRKELLRRIEMLLNAGSHSVEIRMAASGGEVRPAAESFLQQGCNVIVAGGGDGTVSNIASLLPDRDISLGVLPLGTLNHFARDLGIPGDLEGAAQLILAGHTKMVDVGELNGHFFLNNSSLGLYPSIVRRREIWERTGFSRLLAFAAATVSALRRYPFLNARLCVDGKDLFRKSPFIFVGNNQYEIEGLRLGRRSRLDAGTLAIYTAHRTGRFGLMRIAASALLKHLRRNRDFEVFNAHELVLETRRGRLAVALDGEIVHMAPPLRYLIRPAALRVLAPA